MRAKRFSTIAALAIAIFLSSVASSQKRRSRIRLIEPGQFHGDEITAKKGQQWLGLYVKGQRAVLRYSRIRITKVFDDVTDDGTHQKTGKRVSVDGSDEPIFLIKHAAMLAAGPLISVFKQKANFERTLEKEPVHLKLGRRRYILKVVSPDKNPLPCRESQFPTNAELVLISGKSKQTLYTLDGCGNDPSWYLLWAGDLDRDGKLDLYVNVTQHYNVSQRKLFLSSQAGKNRLVRKVASFETVGC